MWPVVRLCAFSWRERPSNGLKASAKSDDDSCSWWRHRRYAFGLAGFAPTPPARSYTCNDNVQNSSGHIFIVWHILTRLQRTKQELDRDHIFLRRKYVSTWNKKEKHRPWLQLHKRAHQHWAVCRIQRKHALHPQYQMVCEKEPINNCQFCDK